MLYSIGSNKKSFKTINFDPNFNAIVAEREEGSNQRDSRNGLGKSTLVDIVHFCLGADRSETLRKNELKDWSFTLSLDLYGKKFDITRGMGAENKIYIDGDLSVLSIKPEQDIEGANFITKKELICMLGGSMFGLENSYGQKFHPTFRSLISYFIRRNIIGFQDPFKHYDQQKEWDIQVHNSFLLDLGWEYASDWQNIREDEKVLTNLSKGIESGLVKNLIGSVGELEAERVRLEEQSEREKNQLKDFRIHKQYKSLESNANSLTERIHDLVNQNVSAGEILHQYKESLGSEKDASLEEITGVYKEAGVVLPGTVKTRFDDIINFHKEVVKNRKDFLEVEIKRIEKEIEARETGIMVFSSERAEIMSTLNTHGALEEYHKIQESHQETLSRLKETLAKLDDLKKITEGKSSLKIKKEQLQQKAIQDLNERKTKRDNAISIFNSNSNYLYKAPGNLVINISSGGYKFAVKIERSGSQGIGNMEIFCYDLMLAQLWASKKPSPGFLIHDSTIFADVDERQKAYALDLAYKKSNELDFQYICLMNSDSIPKEDLNKIDPNFIFDNHIIQKFTDANEDGGLLGIRF